MTRTRTTTLPPHIENLFRDAGYVIVVTVARDDGHPWTDNDEASVVGMMRAIEVDLDFAKRSDG